MRDTPKKYVKGDYSHLKDKSNSRERDETRRPRPNKAKDAPHNKGSKVMRHTFNTIARGFVEAGKPTPS